MKFSRVFSIALATLAVSGLAWAGSLTMTLGTIGYLPSCGGSVEATRSHNGSGGDQLNLVFRHVEQCSNFDILDNNGYSIGYDNKKIPGENGNRSGSFTIPGRIIQPGWNAIRVRISSNSGAHRDDVTVILGASRHGDYPGTVIVVPTSGEGW